ncbi:hypothetical protein ANCDUO_01406 [Ancylostoma duodenale]|uniref:MICOS complex subunit n=1 Tax=Ancylostoma duodenale TaxID=51022 RepID=A0A0C2DYY6_9BILA|nr:hypothetical protein ANCDUO_01406 [Ancylostoma duodenale]
MAIEDPPLVDRISDASKKATNALTKWWNAATAENRPPANPEKMVSIKQLPIYSENDEHQQYKFVVEEPLPLQREFATVRQAFSTEYERFSSRFKAVDRTVTKSKDMLSKTKTYLEDEWTVLPKAAAITVGGMAGFVLGLKRGVIGRTFSTALGLATMAAFCYPHETVDVVRTGIAHSEMAWERFQESPEPPKKSKIDLSPPK